MSVIQTVDLKGTIRLQRQKQSVNHAVAIPPCKQLQGQLYLIDLTLLQQPT